MLLAHPTVTVCLAVERRTRERSCDHIVVLVNDAVLGVTGALDSALKPGGQLSLLAQFMGGEPPKRSLRAAGTIAAGFPMTSGTI